MRINLLFRESIYFLLLLIQMGCSFNQNKKDGTSGKDETNLPIKPLMIFDDKEDGWGADIGLSILSINENDTAKIYKAVSSYHNKQIGLLVSIPKSGEGDKGFGKGITLKSIGDTSNSLLKTLSILYKQNLVSGAKFIASISVGYVNLNEFAKSIGGTTNNTELNMSEYKLFFEGKDDYAELYVNINLKEHWLELREKDPEYRPVIIKILSN